MKRELYLCCGTDEDGCRCDAYEAEQYIEQLEAELDALKASPPDPNPERRNNGCQIFKSN